MAASNFRPGQVDIQEMYLIPPSGNIVDIKNMFVEMSMYENIFSNSVSGVITMVDTFNLISSMPLLGEEWLHFTFKVLDTDEPRSMMFRTYKVSDREIQGNKQIYKLHFTTLEMYIDATMNISKTFTGHAETIISQLLNDHLGSGKDFTYDHSSNLLKLSAPWWSPFKCAGWLTQKAMSSTKDRNSDFLFYETVSGYKFRNMSLAKQEPSQAVFTNDHSTGADDTFARQYNIEMSKVLDFNAPIMVDQIDRFRHDVYKTQVFTHDITFKSFRTIEYDLNDRWDKSPKLNKYPQFTSTLTNFVSPGIKVANEAAYVHNDKVYDWQGTVLSQRKSSVMLNEMMKVNIEIWGRPGIEPGNVVDLNLGKYTQKDPTLDSFYSGRYLIGAIHHRFAPREYRMYVQLIKDSVAETFN